jgi:hypothetical protein
MSRSRPICGPARKSAGVRSWGQVRGSSGGLRAVRGRGAAGTESTGVAGKTCKQALLLCLPPERQTSMVRRGSTVRVRQRALQKPRKSGVSHQDWFAVDRTCGGCGARCGAVRTSRALLRLSKDAKTVSFGLHHRQWRGDGWGSGRVAPRPSRGQARVARVDWSRASEC